VGGSLAEVTGKEQDYPPCFPAACLVPACLITSQLLAILWPLKPPRALCNACAVEITVTKDDVRFAASGDIGNATIKCRQLLDTEKPVRTTCGIDERNRATCCPALSAHVCRPCLPGMTIGFSNAVYAHVGPVTALSLPATC
jgi:hypothetical protein